MSSLPKIISPPPLARTYWVVEGLFLAGAYAGQPDESAHRQRLSGLFSAGIRTIVNLMEDDETNNSGEPFAPYADDFKQIACAANEQVDCLRFPIVDRSITTPERMAKILDAIDGSISKKSPVFVHCFGGIGRTGTVVCCWLLRHGYATGEDVFGLLKMLREADVERAWRDAPENDQQRNFVKKWAQSCRSTLELNSAQSDWFSRLTGFAERNHAEVRQHISVHGTRLASKVNNASFQCGRLELASLGSLRERISRLRPTGTLTVSELVGDAKALHADAANAGAMLQVASQFNLLEMISPGVTPERGVAIYERDPTQGPACAIACGAGTIYRNYFVELDGQVGQTATRQVDCLADVGKALGNASGRLWEMRNGYALPSKSGLAEIDSQLALMSEAELNDLRSKVNIGIQWDTQVTLTGCSHLVTQAYCSALPVAYSGLPAKSWERFARLILEAAYEATLAAAVLNAASTGNRTVYLTLLGGGAFGNDQAWILDAIQRACCMFKAHELEVNVVSYRSSNPVLQQLAATINKQVGSTTIASVASYEAAIPDHYCPGCGARQEAFLRYPWYFCNDCLELAEDAEGRRLEFGNLGLSGGFCWNYVDSLKTGGEACGSVLCLIRGRPVIVTEARFGGVVAQPMNSEYSSFRSIENMVDLAFGTR